MNDIEELTFGETFKKRFASGCLVYSLFAALVFLYLLPPFQSTEAKIKLRLPPREETRLLQPSETNEVDVNLANLTTKPNSFNKSWNSLGIEDDGAKIGSMPVVNEIKDDSGKEIMRGEQKVRDWIKEAEVYFSSSKQREFTSLNYHSYIIKANNDYHRRIIDDSEDRYISDFNFYFHDTNILTNYYPEFSINSSLISYSDMSLDDSQTEVESNKILSVSRYFHNFYNHHRDHNLLFNNSVLNQPNLFYSLSLDPIVSKGDKEDQKISIIDHDHRNRAGELHKESIRSLPPFSVPFKSQEALDQSQQCLREGKGFLHFLHMRKAAGSSLYMTLYRIMRLPEKEDFYIHRFKVSEGDVYNISCFSTPGEMVTMLNFRHPIDRIMSSYTYEGLFKEIPENGTLLDIEDRIRKNSNLFQRHSPEIYPRLYYYNKEMDEKDNFYAKGSEATSTRSELIAYLLYVNPNYQKPPVIISEERGLSKGIEKEFEEKETRFYKVVRFGNRLYYIRPFNEWVEWTWQNYLNRPHIHGRRVYYHVDNYYTRTLVDRYRLNTKLPISEVDFLLAKRILKSMDIIIIIEWLKKVEPESPQNIQEYIGAILDVSPEQVQIQKKNVQKDTNRKSFLEISEEEVKLVTVMNQYDLLLYEYAKELAIEKANHAKELQKIRKSKQNNISDSNNDLTYSCKQSLDDEWFNVKDHYKNIELYNRNNKSDADFVKRYVPKEESVPLPNAQCMAYYPHASKDIYAWNKIYPFNTKENFPP